MKKQLEKGLYLVIDPSKDLSFIVDRLPQVLGKGIVAVQVWDNFRSLEDLPKICCAIMEICRRFGTPVLLNNRWEEAIGLGMDGVHLDNIPMDWSSLRLKFPKDMILGMTVNNDLDVARWAVQAQLDYVSFCSMFPSDTATSCDLVALDSVRKLTEEHRIPVFLAGGIRPDNLDLLNELDYHGIAVVSGIMGAEDPARSVELYNEKIKK